MLNYHAVDMRYDPYPLAVLRPALDLKQYDELVENFPDINLFGKIPKYDYKLSLSEKFNDENYRRFIAGNTSWRMFHSRLKSDAFIQGTVDFLLRQNIDLGLKEAFEPKSKRFGRAALSALKGRLPSKRLRLKSRFEFSVLKADGGEVSPHTDTPKKVITLVLSMIKENEWPLSFGGGLDINRTTDPAYAFNMNNRIVPWEKMTVVDTVEFVPNQCTVFVKTFNSLHSVRKMTQKGSKALRKTITVVIERDD